MFVFYLYIAGACFLMALFALLPSYFMSSVGENFASAKLESLKNLPVSVPDKETMGAIKDINMKISLIENAEKNNFSILDKVVDEIISRKMPDIKITDINYEKKDGVKNIKLNGVAPNRERLLLFRQMLEADPDFSSVDLPISNFVKGENINFDLNLTAK